MKSVDMTPKYGPADVPLTNSLIAKSIGKP